MCLYLTEPPSVNELNRKKRLLEYYNKVIKGEAAETIEDVKYGGDSVEEIFHLSLPESQKSNNRFKEKHDESRIGVVDYAIDNF